MVPRFRSWRFAAILAFASAQALPGAAAPISHASLPQLLAGAAIASPDGSFVFDDFRIAPPSPGDIPGMTVTASSTDSPQGNIATLLFQLTGASRIQGPGEQLDITLSFRGSTTRAQHVLSVAALDARGGTLGTTGTATVRLTQTLRNGDTSPLATLSVLDSSDTSDQLVDEIALVGGPRWDAVVRLEASSGNDPRSFAVLSDFSTSYQVSRVPEPVTRGLAIAACALFAAVRRKGLTSPR